MSEVITLNVGGMIYATTLSTLTKYPESMLGAIFSGNYTPTSLDSNGHNFIDRDGRMFCYVLNFLRSDKLCLPKDFQDFDLLETEVDFYQIPALISAVQELKQRPSDNKYSGCILEMVDHGNMTLLGPNEILKQLPLPQQVLQNITNDCTSVYLRNDPQSLRIDLEDYKMKIFQYLEQNHWHLHTSNFVIPSRHEPRAHQIVNTSQYSVNEQVIMSEVITLNVGGVIYATTLSTLTKYPESMLGAMFSGNYTPTSLDANGHLFIDRDGRMFCYVLNFLRSNELCLPNDFQDFALLKTEADFYQIPDLISAIQRLEQKPPNDKYSDSKYSGCVLDIVEVENQTLQISGPAEILQKLPLPQDVQRQIIGSHKNITVYLTPPVGTRPYKLLDHKMEIFQYLKQNHWQLHSSNYSAANGMRNKYVWCLP